MRKNMLAIILAVALLVGFVMYNVGKFAEAKRLILNAEPFILEYVTEPADFFTVYIDYGEYGIHEYTGFVG